MKPKDLLVHLEKGNRTMEMLERKTHATDWAYAPINPHAFAQMNASLSTQITQGYGDYLTSIGNISGIY